MNDQTELGWNYFIIQNVRFRLNATASDDSGAAWLSYYDSQENRWKVINNFQMPYDIISDPNNEADMINFLRRICLSINVLIQEFLEQFIPPSDPNDVPEFSSKQEAINWYVKNRLQVVGDNLTVK